MSNKVINIDESIHYKLKIISSKRKTSLKKLLTEAINYIIEKYKDDLR